MHDRIRYETIVAAKKGNADAMERIVRHYMPFIVSRSRRSYYDAYDNACCFVDSSIADLITARLMYAIVCRFDTERMPEGETRG